MRLHLRRVAPTAVLAVALALTPSLAQAKTKKHHRSRASSAATKVQPFPSRLPKGKTVVGAWSVVGFGGAFATSSISYLWPLRSAPKIVVVPNGVDGTDDGCPGNAVTPKSTNGKLCLYSGKVANNLAEFGVIAPGTGVQMAAERTGAVVFAKGADPTLPFAVHGTWAVTGN
jgi:hypothetical protein